MLALRTTAATAAAAALTLANQASAHEVDTQSRSIAPQAR
jgi:hypothetical protein